MSYQTGVNQYKQVSAQSLQTAAPQEVVRMLLGGAIDKISAAKGAIERSEFLEKQQNIRKARQIIDALKSALDMDEGGNIAQNLDDLYGYMTRCLFDANKTDDLALLDEVSGLLADLKSGWDGVCEKSAGDNTEMPQSGVVLGTA
ncbi:MAG: flagellar export chaperone FliS [Pseudomonadales bacterium]|nr:flagellar export chaperone FliS [Pseudomonadales bacterium]